MSRVASQLSVNKPVSHEWSFANVLFRTFDALASITLFWISAQVYFSLFGILREIFTNFSSFLKENSINCKKKPECNKLMSSSVPMNENSCTPRSFMSPTPGESRAVSRNSNFGLQLQPLKVFGSGSRTIWFIKNQKPFYYLYNWLAPKTMSVELELKVQAPTPQPGWKILAYLLRLIRLPDVLERQDLSLNLISKLLMSLILEKHLAVLEFLPTSLKILE